MHFICSEAESLNVATFLSAHYENDIGIKILK